MSKKEKSKVNKFKMLLNFFKINSLLMTLVYFIYALVTERGNDIINIVLTIIYFIYMVITIIGILKNDKDVKKVAKKEYKWSKMLIKLFTFLFIDKYLILIYNLIINRRLKCFVVSVGVK